MPRVIGLTGRVGSGKTTAQRCILEVGQYEIIDLDLIGHQLLKDKRIIRLLLNEFGSGVLDEDGQISRPNLGEIVFNSEEKLSCLNRIMHPLIKENVLEQVGALDEKQQGVIVGALIDEIALLEVCDHIVVIDANDDDIRNFVGRKADILDCQRTRLAYCDQADTVIFNDFTPNFLEDCNRVFSALLTQG